MGNQENVLQEAHYFVTVLYPSFRYEYPGLLRIIGSSLRRRLKKAEALNTEDIDKYCSAISLCLEGLHIIQEGGGDNARSVICRRNNCNPRIVCRYFGTR